tara:strand:- start:845 stop:1012 length:168 start_codon:yes stop_codon:yes gene_type:complete
MKNKIRKYLKNLGLNMKLYNGYFMTDTKIVAKIDDTIIYINYDFKGHRAYPINNE